MPHKFHHRVSHAASHVKRHYILRPVFAVLFVIFAILSLLYIKTGAFDYLKYNVLLPLTTQSMSVTIKDSLPDQTNRIYFDIEKTDFNDYEFDIQSFNGDKVNFNQTPYGATAILNSSDFDSNVDLKMTTYTKGDVNILMTYVDGSGHEIASKTQTEHFDRAPTLDIAMYLLLALTIFCLVMSVHLIHLFKTIGRVFKRGKR